MKRKITLLGMIAILVLGSLVACSSQESEPMIPQQQDQGVSTEPAEAPIEAPTEAPTEAPAEAPAEAVPSTGGIETETEDPSAPVSEGDQGTTEMAPDAPAEGADPLTTEGQ